MYCRSVLLLLSLFAAVVTSQNTQACTDAQNALAANQPCFNASSAVLNFLGVNTSIGDEVDLNVYCAADCRNLANRAIIACADGDNVDAVSAFASLTRLICATDADNVNCFDFLGSPQFQALTDAADMFRACPDEIPPGQMCPSACQTAVQNFVIDGGCCTVLLFDIGSEIAGDELNILGQCPIDLSRGGTCTEIGGGATGLKAIGNILLFAIIIAVQAVI